MSLIELKGMTWDHERGLDCLVQSNDLLIQKCGISIKWDARSLLAFGDQHISEFYSDYDLMVIDHPHIPDAVHAEAVIAFEDLTTPAQLNRAVCEMRICMNACDAEKSFPNIVII